MSFVTTTYLIFLALVFALYWRLAPGRRRRQNLLLLAASYGFYAWWDARFCLLLLISSLVDFGVGSGLGKVTGRRGRRALLGASLACNLGLLGTFKYFDFFSRSLARLLGELGLKSDPVLLRLVLPVGISFYTFQTLSYTLDVYRGRIRPARSLLDYMAYVAFFPQLVAGPIERAARLLPQFERERRFDPARARDGLRQMLWGFFKKLAVADNLGVLVDRCYGAPGAVGGGDLALATGAFALQIYLDFSAYSDIAIGTGRLLGFDLMRDFAYPYFSQSPAEFWRRWHISLTSWFRDYVYIPLGGSRRGRARRCVNLMATFLLSGLWHGAGLNFVVWGGFHGLALLPRALSGDSGVAAAAAGGAAAAWARRLGTFLLVCVGWVFFRAATLPEAFWILGRIGRDFGTLTVWPSLSGHVRAAFMFAAAALCLEWRQREQAHPLVFGRCPRAGRWLAYTVLVWLTLYFGTVERSPFIYFQF